MRLLFSLSFNQSNQLGFFTKQVEVAKKRTPSIQVEVFEIYQPCVLG